MDSLTNKNVQFFTKDITDVFLIVLQ